MFGKRRDERKEGKGGTGSPVSGRLKEMTSPPVPSTLISSPVLGSVTAVGIWLHDPPDASTAWTLDAVEVSGVPSEPLP